MGKSTNTRKAASFYTVVADLIVVVGVSSFLYLGLQIRHNQHGVGIPAAAAKALPAGLGEPPR